jgi:ubiquinone/menaquinone biosynthesis C-methylase UbiE
MLGALQQQALAVLRPTKADRLLDVGCGTGVAVRCIARTVDVAVRMDLCPGMIHRARDLAPAEPRAHFLVADAHQLPFLDGAFTAELCTTALRTSRT